METSSPAEDLLLQPYDVIRASKAEMVYLNLEGQKGGAFSVTIASRYRSLS